MYICHYLSHRSKVFVIYMYLWKHALDDIFVRWILTIHIFECYDNVDNNTNIDDSVVQQIG